MNKPKNVGRPSGRIKTAKIEVAIEPDVKETFMELLAAEGKKASVEMSMWIRQYIKERTEGSEK